MAKSGLEDPRFIKGLLGIAKEYGIPMRELLGTLSFESGFMPNAYNPNGGASGIIQWLQSSLDSVHGKNKVMTNNLRGMTAFEQLPYMKQYLDHWKLKNYRDKKTGMLPSGAFYTSIFSPDKLGYIRPGRDVNFYQYGTKAYKDNYKLDRNRNKWISMSEIVGMADNKYNEYNKRWDFQKLFGNFDQGFPTVGSRRVYSLINSTQSQGTPKKRVYSLINPTQYQK